MGKQTLKVPRSKSHNKSHNKSQNKRRKSKKQSLKNPKCNLVYMAKPIYGGWVSFTAHLAKKKDYPLFRISNKTESKTRDYGYGVEYQNLNIDDLVKKPNLLITAIDKNFYQYLPKIRKATIVIHDPTELKEPVLDVLKSKRFKVITIRETVEKLLRDVHGIKSQFLHHPFYQFPKSQSKPESSNQNKNSKIKKNKSISLSRVDFDKHTDIIVDANQKLQNPVDIYGALNDLYVYHKLSKTPFKKYYKGRFPKTFDALVDLLASAKFVVDMSAINKDGGGSQYTFLEAIHMDCALVLNKKWVEGVKTPFKHGVNCYVVEDADGLHKLLKSNPNTKQVVANAKKMLTPHISGKGW